MQTLREALLVLRAALRRVLLVLLVLPPRRGAAGVCRFRLRLCLEEACPGRLCLGRLCRAASCLEGPCPGRLCRAALCLAGLCLEGPCPDTAGAGACPDRERPWEECDECAASALCARE